MYKVSIGAFGQLGSWTIGFLGPLGSLLPLLALLRGPFAYKWAWHVVAVYLSVFVWFNFTQK
jgi:hypothetical protein